MPEVTADGASRAEPAATGLFLNRELAALEFNFRVLAMAHDRGVPLLERVRYLSIVASNLDEFFEVRVAMLRYHQACGQAQPGPDGIPPAELARRIRTRVLALITDAYAVWRDELQPQLAACQVYFSTRQQWNPAQRRWLESYVEDSALPMLSPLEMDAAHRFPRILSKTLNIAMVMRAAEAPGHATRTVLLGVPRSLPRLLRLPDEIGGPGDHFVLLAEVLCAYAGRLYPGAVVLGAYPFRVTRNSELLVDESEVENLAQALKQELPARGYGDAARLEIGVDCPDDLAAMLAANLQLDPGGVYRCDGPVNLVRVGQIHDWLDRPELKFAPFTPRLPDAARSRKSLFEQIAQHDILLHHPYESFNPVIDLLRQAALDPDVLAIKQTLYRAGVETPLLEPLVDAARHGKDVTVVIELRARFDEAANIQLAARLHENGVQVVHGVVGFKTHAKMLLIIRRERSGLRRYAHLSTGNYHQLNSRMYTDIGLMTADPEITEDVHKVFQQLSGLGPIIQLKRLLHSPFTLYAGVIERIERETANAHAGHPARIMARLNALNEPHVIAALYRASQAGVEIDLVVRGACTLRPGLRGISERIRVRSIVGRFLEHSRVYWFANDGDPELFCASADWMERNLLRRIEIAFPISDPALAARTFEETLANALADNTQAWLLDSQGRYTRAQPGQATPYSAQQGLLRRFDS
jgi:polyphosphate kinase